MEWQAAALVLAGAASLFSLSTGLVVLGGLVLVPAGADPTLQARCRTAGLRAIRSVAQKNALPVDRITEVRVLDPYFYR